MTTEHRCVLGIILLLAMPCCAADRSPATRDASDRDHLRTMIADLPSARQLKNCLATIREADTSESQIASAKKTIDKAKDIVPKLRKRIQPDTSILGYPGLIAKGNLSYSEDSRVYALYVGVYLLQHEGKEPYDFRAVFKEDGIITKVEDVIWRR